ncbi:hypothetical protein CAPTEDRAFT_117289 [Capitella teleta]|uniref:Uncharacterized protein n=1 Tax=Capitella teleta TaxID=283909 RepID=R7UDF4_CAPTE|nr:hypothetical protein CAPTEDRAFT_117289 [Capitella teleta]|eukprot:ELU01297.1 hypothetical protein CAPTEDRAFT_117289 [Capitella teleta]
MHEKDIQALQGHSLPKQLCQTEVNSSQERKHAKFLEFRCTPNEVRRWLEKLNPGNASSPNAISPKVYKSLSMAMCRPLHAIHERMLEL